VTLHSTYRPRERRSRRRWVGLARIAVRVAVLAAVFAGGIALGQALDDNPDAGGTVTYVRTLAPQPLTAIPDTVTVTTGAPGG